MPKNKPYYYVASKEKGMNSLYRVDHSGFFKKKESAKKFAKELSYTGVNTKVIMRKKKLTGYY